MSTWKKGDTIDVPAHGPAIITFVRDDSLGLRWADGIEAVLRRQQLEALLSERSSQPVSDASSAASAGQPGQGAPESAAGEQADTPTLAAAQQRHFTRLADALEQVAVCLDAPVTAQPPDWRTEAFHERVQLLLDREAQAIETLMAVVTGRLAEAAVAASCSDADLQGVIEALREACQQLQQLREQARHLPASASQYEDRRLLVAAPDHPLTEFRAWLAQLMAVLADPLAELRKRGLPVTDGIELPFNLKLTSAPELTALKYWLEARTSARLAAEMASELELEPPEPPEPRESFWSRWGPAVLLTWLLSLLIGGGSS